MSDATTTDDKAKPQDAVHPHAQAAAEAGAKLSADANKPAAADSTKSDGVKTDGAKSDSPKADAGHTDGKTDGAKPEGDKTAAAKDGGEHKDSDSQDTSSWLMSQIMDDWKSLKNYSGFGDKANDPCKLPDFKSTEAKGTEAKADSFDFSKYGNIFSPSTTSGLDKAQSPLLSGPQGASAGADSHWYDSITSMGGKLSNLASQGWDKISTGFSDAYKSITSDASNTTKTIEPKMGADGKVDYFQSNSDNNTRQLSADEFRNFDKNGSTVIKNFKTHEITSQSADGSRVYQREADGTERIRTGDTEFERKNGQYIVRDNKGHETTVNSEAMKTQLGKDFQAAQINAGIDSVAADLASAKPGMVAGNDGGVRMRTHENTDVRRYADGHVEIRRDGKHILIDRKNHRFDIEENGKWRAITPEEMQQWRNCHRTRDNKGGEQTQIGDVKVDAAGAIKTDDNMTVAARQSDGKVVGTIPTDSGKPAQLIINADKSSDLIHDGKDSHFDPNSVEHRAEQFNINPDGSRGACLFNLNAADNTFSTDDFTWNGDGSTYLDWNDVTIDAAGSVTNGDGSTIWDNTTASYTAAATHSEQAVRGADSAVAAASAKIGAQAMTSSDLADLHSAAGDLSGALAQALSSGNFDAACQIMSAQSDVNNAISQASQQVALGDIMRSQNMTDSQIVDAADNVGSMGAFGAAVHQEVAVLGPNVQTFEGKLAYMSQFGISGLTDEQAQRLSA